MKVTYSIVRMGLLCILLSLASIQMSSAAGVTIITHGYQGSSGHPVWLDAMGNAVAARAGSSTLVYSLDIASITPLNYEYGSNLTASTNAEIVIKLYWDQSANPCNYPWATTANIAASVVPFLLTNNLTPANGGPIIPRPLVEMPIHLIGHSRGGSVVLEIAHLLAQRGVWVDHVTTLDPHPITDLDLNALCILHPFSTPDPSVQLYDNVVFADEYFQFDSDGLAGLSGVPVAGATQQFLNDRFASDGLPEGLTNDHQEVHDWYHGTIDTNATTVAGHLIPRAAWYVPGDISFRFSLIAQGQALRKQIQASYIGAGLKWNGATRSSAYDRTDFRWPNIELENTNNIWVVQATESMRFQIRYQNSFSTNLLKIEFGTDNDQNPYNNTVPNIFLTSTNSADANTYYTGQRSWTPTSGDDRKFLYAKITDYKGYVRYYYFSQPFQVLPPPNNPPGMPVNLAPANGAVYQSLTPTLLASVFSDSDGDSQASSRWIIRRQSDGVAVFDSLNDPVNKTSIMVPAGILTNAASYSWSVSYTDSRGAQGSASAATTFTTQSLPHNPVFLSPRLLADGRFTAIVSGETGHTYVIEASTNFVNWTQINTNTLTSPTAPFTDPLSLVLTRRFYRAVAQ